MHHSYFNGLLVISKSNTISNIKYNTHTYTLSNTHLAVGLLQYVGKKLFKNYNYIIGEYWWCSLKTFYRNFKNSRVAKLVVE